MATTKVSTKLLETVGVAEGGTGATSTSAARTSLGLVIGTNVLAPNGSAASLTNLPAGGASAAEAANIMINSFNIAAAGGFAFQNMVDGVVDEFEDETGIDTSTSTYETYDATNDFYTSLGSTTTIPGSSDWTKSSSEVITTGEVTTLIDNKAITYDNSLTGDFDWEYTWTTGNGWSMHFGWFPTAEDGTINRGSPYGGANSMTNSVHVRNDNTYLDMMKGSSAVSDNEFAYTHSGTKKIRLSRVSGTFTLWIDDGLEYTWAYTSTATGRVFMGLSYGTTTTSASMTFVTTASAASNMTLVSNASTALAAPDDANIVIWQEDGSSAITLNTDLKAYASRNGGTTYTQMTLAEVASLTTGRILTGTVDISGQSSATAMKYKIETLNTKEQKIHAVALQWS